MCVNTILYTCSLRCGGRKGCEIWSLFQEEQLAPSPSGQNQAGLLPCFGHLATLCRVRPVQQEEEAGICRVRGPLMLAPEWQCPLCMSWCQAQPGSHQEGSLQPAPCCAGCANVLKEAGWGLHGSLFYLLWLEQLVRRSCHFFPGCVEPVSLVQRAAEPKPIMKGTVTYLCVVLLICRKGVHCKLAAFRYCLSHLQSHLFFSKGVPMQNHGMPAINSLKHCYRDATWLWLPEGRFFISLLFFFFSVIVTNETSNASASLGYFSGWYCWLSWFYCVLWHLVFFLNLQVLCIFWKQYSWIAQNRVLILAMKKD